MTPLAMMLCRCGRVLAYLNVADRYGVASPWPSCVGCGQVSAECRCAPVAEA